MNPISIEKRLAGSSQITALFFAIAPHGASAQPAQQETPSNIECLERLEIPDYPPLPRTARIQAIQSEGRSL